MADLPLSTYDGKPIDPASPPESHIIKIIRYGVMFDYQAGEKFKLTLITVGFAGLMAGMLFTMLIMPQPDTRKKNRPIPAYMNNPDATGKSPENRRELDPSKWNIWCANCLKACVLQVSVKAPAVSKPWTCTKR